MNKVKQQILQLRKTTPRHIQWLLLGAAFVVVLMLLTLLLSGGDKNADLGGGDASVSLVFDPDVESIDWSNTTVGEKRTQTIKISSTMPARIMDIRHNKEIPGLASPKHQTCTNLAQIDSTTACTIVIEYAPNEDMTPRVAPMFIDWRAANESDDMKKTATLTILLGANEATKPNILAEPVAESKPQTATEPKSEPAPQPEPVYTPEPVPIKSEIRQEIEQIAPAPLPEPAVPAPAPRATSCSDFAIPGYNLAGVQSGWIKPTGGAYYYHPFSDKKCENPTGTYNPDTGIITDIDDTSKKIGTDAEHIGYQTITSGGAIPQLSNAPSKRPINRARQLSADELSNPGQGMAFIVKAEPNTDKDYESSDPDVLVNSKAHDRRFVLRQYKPIPATIVSDIRADVAALETGIPVRATVDRNVYADNGRTVIIPTGTLLMGYVTGTLPGPYKSVGRMDIKWYQFVLPNGVEFNFKEGFDAFSGDAQGRSGVPGHGSTDYIEQFVMPMLTAIVPAAVNMIAPVADKFVNQIDLDNNTVVQSGTVRSSELAKNEIITAWNQVAQKLLVDMVDNTVPPFSIAAGTRITVYSPVDLMVTCGENTGKACSVREYNTDDRRRGKKLHDAEPDYTDGSWTGQVRSFNLTQYCDQTNNKWDIKKGVEEDIAKEGYDYRTVLMYCQSLNYQAKNNAKQDALYQSQQKKFTDKYTVSETNNSVSGSGYGVSGDQAYNQEVLGLKYDDDGYIENPFQSAAAEANAAAALLQCEDGTNPDENGCCTGEIYTDMGEDYLERGIENRFNCCPSAGGDCFPPLL